MSVPPPADGQVAEELDPVQLAARILADIEYLVLATADADGVPWASPVWFAHRGTGQFVWVSRPISRHSSNIAVNPAAALTVFDSRVRPGGAAAFYAQVTASPTAPADLEDDLALFNARSVEQGLEEWGPEQVTGDAELRLYRAVASEASVLVPDGGPDIRVRVPASG